MWQDLKHLSPQVAALYMAHESDLALRRQQRPEDVVDAEAVEKTKARIKKRWAAAQAGPKAVPRAVTPFRKRA